MTKPTSPDDNKQVANRAMVQAAVLAAVVLLCIVAWLAFDFLLLLFASILFGVLIHGVSCWLSRHTPLPYKASMGAFFVVLLLGLGGGGWLVAPSIAEQADALSASSVLSAFCRAGRTARAASTPPPTPIPGEVCRLARSGRWKRKRVTGRREGVRSLALVVRQPEQLVVLLLTVLSQV